MPLIEYILSAIAPHECVGCRVEGTLVCSACSELFRPVPPRCYRCQQLTTGYKTCLACRRHTALFSVFPFATYEELPKRLLYKMKYERLRSGARTTASLLATVMPPLPEGVLITHVPTATTRIRERGYDQAALIARELATQLGCEYAPLLSRYGQQRQVGKNRQERREQMKALFAVAKPVTARDRHILLVDDVLTTGATLEACAAALRESGAKRVSAATFAAA